MRRDKKMEQICILSFLGLNSCFDLRRKQISLVLVVLYVILSVPYLIWYRQKSVLFLAGALPGILMLCIGKASGGALGQGDGLVILVSGLYMGIWRTVEWIMSALLLAAAWAGFLLVVKKKGWKESFPFVPFLLAAYILRASIKVMGG